LELVTHKVNCERGDGGKYGREKTHCPAGHDYATNAFPQKRKGVVVGRFCRACFAERSRKARRAAGSLPWSTRTACPRGHEFTPENTRVRRNGRRACRSCERDRERKRIR
jgi:hypothetical protein